MHQTSQRRTRVERPVPRRPGTQAMAPGSLPGRLSAALPSTEYLLRLQRSVGNQAVGQLVRGFPLQLKLEEHDAVAFRTWVRTRFKVDQLGAVPARYSAPIS